MVCEWHNEGRKGGVYLSDRDLFVDVANNGTNYFELAKLSVNRPTYMYAHVPSVYKTDG